MKRPKGKPEKLGDALSNFLDQSGLADRIEQAAIIPEWEQLVGSQIATVTAPLSIARDGTLFVAVRTHSWMQELSLMEPQLLVALNTRTGRAKITRIHWRLMTSPPPQGGGH
jgi:predicted nucleic acid-binding Zn ribbon protein